MSTQEGGGAYIEGTDFPHVELVDAVARHLATCYACSQQQPCAWVEREQEQERLWRRMLADKIKRGEA